MQLYGSLYHCFVHQVKMVSSRYTMLFSMLSGAYVFFTRCFIAHSVYVAESIGQLLQGIVKSVDRSRKIVHMSSDLDLKSKYVVYSFLLMYYSFIFLIVIFLLILWHLQTKELKGISIDLLVPGMMVNARVQSTLENGVLLSFLTYFTGTVSLHLCCYDRRLPT